MKKPSLDMSIDYNAVQSSALGTVYVQGGYAFDEGKNLLGTAPEWGPALFMENGKPTDPFTIIVEFARAHPFVEDETDDIASMTETEPAPVRRGPGRPRKGPDVPGFNRQPV